MRILQRAKSLIRKYGLIALGAAPSDPLVRFQSGNLFSHFVHRGLNIDPRLYPDRKKYLLTDVAITNGPILKLCQQIDSTDELSPKEIKNSIFYVCFECDSDALPHLKRIMQCGGTYFPPLLFGKTHYRFTNRIALDVIKDSWRHDKQLSHLHVDVHENICEALELTKLLDGDFVEIGVYLGGSAFTALNYMKAIGVDRPTWLLDTFDGFSYPEAASSADGIWKDTHKLYGPAETMRRVSDVLVETGQDFHMVQSNICTEELPREITKIAVANIDVDIYEATRAAMEKVAPLIVAGGIMICEDPTSTPGLYGASVAMHEFLEGPEGRKFMPLFKGGQYFLINVGYLCEP